MKDGDGSNVAAPPEAATAAAAAAESDSEGGGGKMFFTTSDLIARINQSVAEVSALSADGDAADGATATTPAAGGFELRRQMPDGSTRRADAADTAVADLQSKIKQTAAVLSALNADEKMEWAQQQRAEGNRVFARGDYTEAMDVYITCLVAMDKLKGSVDTDDEGNSSSTAAAAATTAVFSQEVIERDIQLPVLLNLALCALKLGMLRKAESFCNFALETTLGTDCPKAYFRRGRARMLMGSYDDARVDLERAMELLLSNNANAETDEDDGDGATQEAELKAVKKELQKLERLEMTARKHEKTQKKAMKRLWDDNNDSKNRASSKGSGSGANGHTPNESISTSATKLNDTESLPTNTGKDESPGDAKVQSDKGLYSDVRERRQFSTLRAKKKVEVLGGSLLEAELEEEDDDTNPSTTFFKWYLSLFERCLRKTLHILGDEEGAKMEYPSPHDKDK